MCSRYSAIQRSIATNVPDVPAKHYLPYTRHTLAPSLSTPCRRKKTTISIAWPYARVNQSHKIPYTAKSTGTRKTLVATPHGLDRAINTQTHSTKQLHHQKCHQVHALRQKEDPTSSTSNTLQCQSNIFLHRHSRIVYLCAWQSKPHKHLQQTKHTRAQRTLASPLQQLSIHDCIAKAAAAANNMSTSMPTIQNAPCDDRAPQSS